MSKFFCPNFQQIQTLADAFASPALFALQYSNCTMT